MAWPIHPNIVVEARQDYDPDAVVARRGTTLRKGKKCLYYHIVRYREYFLECGYGIGYFYE